MESKEMVQVRWDMARLLEMGLNEEFIIQLSGDEIQDFLKGVLYLKEKCSGFM